jgi:hypothetical protein
MELGFIRIPRWLIFLAPSFPALITLLVMRPHALRRNQSSPEDRAETSRKN